MMDFFIPRDRAFRADGIRFWLPTGAGSLTLYPRRDASASATIRRKLPCTRFLSLDSRQEFRPPAVSLESVCSPRRLAKFPVRGAASTTWFHSH